MFAFRDENLDSRYVCL